MLKQFEIINPITQNKDFIVLNKIDPISVQEAYLKVFNIDTKKYFENINTLYLCKCTKTNYRFFYPFTIAGDEKFYQKLQKYDWYYQPDKWEFTVSRKLITKGNLLEIGCGKGDFLLSIKKFKQLYIKGSEFNSDAIAFCRSKELDVENFKIAELPKDTFDYLVSFQVLEHIFDIKSFFENAFKLLKKGGKLIIGVPNTKSFVFYPYSEYYFQNGSLLLNMPPHHIGWWDKNSLEKTAKIFGFHTKSFYYEPLSLFRKDLVLKNLSNYSGISNKNKIFHLVHNKFTNKLYKGETLLAVFEK